MSLTFETTVYILTVLLVLIIVGGCWVLFCLARSKDFKYLGCPKVTECKPPKRK